MVAGPWWIHGCMTAKATVRSALKPCLAALKPIGRRSRTPGDVREFRAPTGCRLMLTKREVGPKVHASRTRCGLEVLKTNQARTSEPSAPCSASKGPLSVKAGTPSIRTHTPPNPVRLRSQSPRA